MPQIFNKPKKTFNAKDFGVTLKISDEALAKIERMKEENLKNFRKTKLPVWR